MSDEPQRPPGGGVRRVSRKDRKSRLEPAAPLFPSDDAEQGEAPSRPLPFDEVRDAPDEVDAALAEPPGDAVVPQDDARFAPPSPRAVQVAPPEERFPPLIPEVPDPFTREPAPTPPRRRLARQDKIALFFVAATVVLLVWIVAVWQNPSSWLNPLAPATLFVEVTATPQPQPTSAPTLPPTTAPTASFTPLVGAATQGAPGGQFPTATLAPLSTVGGATATSSSYPFALAASGIVYAPNSNGRGCDWSSIAGTVTGLRGEPVDGYGIHIVGDELDEKVFTGTAQTFGPGGFELFLNGVPQEARFTVRLLSSVGAPLSDEIVVVTSDKCDQNVALVNFVQQRAF